MAFKTFAELKKARSGQVEKLTSQMTEMSNKGGKRDDTFWRPTRDQAGNASAVIRFLPAPLGEDLATVKLFEHVFKGPSGWYINKSLTSIGKDDPVSEMNMQLWSRAEAEGDERLKTLARQRKRKLTYISNILVVDDKLKPENNGKVFKFKYGAKIFEMMFAAMKPEFDGVKPKDPFDMWNGVPFALRMKTVMKFPNYNDSTFLDPCPIAGSDKEIEEIHKQCHSLAAEVAPEAFKSYDQLKNELTRAVGGSATAAAKPAGPAAKPKPTKAVAAPEDDGDDFDSVLAGLGESDDDPF